MSRPFTKINPLKKTFYLEKRSIELLAEMAREDSRSPSMTLELLIESAWASRRKAKPTAKR